MKPLILSTTVALSFTEIASAFVPEARHSGIATRAEKSWIEGGSHS
jgi:hypothetical protein